MSRCLGTCAAELEALTSAREFEHLTQVLLLEQEEERRRIAADLHDEIGQCLSAVQFAIGGLRQQIGDRMTDGEHKLCANLAQRIARAMEELRRICMGLRPPMLDDLGVVSTIEWFCSELRQVLTNVEVVHILRADDAVISPPTKVAIFRIVQEACSNACKYAAARRLSVLLETDVEGIRLEVVDDGVGFDTESVRSFGSGLGLAGMCERATMTNGCLTVRSQVGTGTRVMATWPADGAY